MEIRYFDGNDILTHSENDRNVFHYTSPDSLLSILKYKKLWLSDSQFMNDRSEYVYIKEIFAEAAKGTTHEAKSDEDEKHFAEYILGFPYGGLSTAPLPNGKKGGFRGIVRTRYYLLCASLNPDSHSLWNYYVKNSSYQGYNIGIAVNSLLKSLAHPTWRITHGMVNYDRDLQIRELHKTIKKLSKQFDKDIESGRNEDACIDHYQEELADYLLQRCMFYKSPAFAHEEEYRFVIEAPALTETIENSNSIIDYHTGNGGLIVPHLEVGFKPETIITDITLAPMMEREVAKHGIQRLLASTLDNHKIKIPIKYSQIDVRY